MLDIPPTVCGIAGVTRGTAPACAVREMWLHDKYKLGERIGYGGMGDVYCAEQPDLARTVAVKFMRTELLANPQMRRRFHTEAIVGGRLQHPNVVAVIDYGEAQDGVPFLVFEHVRGTPLARVLSAEGALGFRRAARLFAEILAGLAEAHAEGIVHADVKTDNVIIDRYRGGTEVAKLLDFGLARFVGEPPLESGADKIVSGTPEYLAPEIIRGVLPTTRSDVYSAGVMFYELLTGATPFRGSTIAEVLCRHLEDDVVPPSVRCIDRYIPTAIDTVVMRSLAKDPLERFADAEEFRRAVVAAIPAEEPAPTRDESIALASAMTRRDIRPVVDRHFAVRSKPQPARADAEVRRRLGLAISTGDVAQIVGGYLELAGLHIDGHALMAAAKELEEAIDLLTQGGGAAASDAPEPVWRLLLPLASIYAGLGDRERTTARLEAGRRLAERHRSTLGLERAQALSAMLRRKA